MVKASDIIRDVSRDLNDQVPGHEYTRWSFEQLASYYAEALIEAASKAQWLFTSTKIVPLQSGSQQEACDCTVITRIIGECTQHGEVLTYAASRSSSDEYVWGGDSVSPCRSDSIHSSSRGFTSAAIDSPRQNRFWVWPAVVPSGTQRYALVECYRQPESDDLDLVVPQRIVKCIKQWMLFRALIVDSENNAAIREVAVAHHQAYNESLIALEQENARNNSVREIQNSPSQSVSPRT